MVPQSILAEEIIETLVEEATWQKKERALWDKQVSGYDNRVLKMYKNAYGLSIQKIRSVELASWDLGWRG